MEEDGVVVQIQRNTAQEDIQFQSNSKTKQQEMSVNILPAKSAGSDDGRRRGAEGLERVYGGESGFPRSTKGKNTIPVSEEIRSHVFRVT